jgi:Transposase DDE domain group 1
VWAPRGQQGVPRGVVHHAPAADRHRAAGSFSYQAQSWTKLQRVVAKVECHQGELYPRVGFVVTSLIRPAERMVKLYNGRGTVEQWIREGKQALRWTRLSCRAFRDNAARLQLFALAYNLANFLRSLFLPDKWPSDR